MSPFLDLNDTDAHDKETQLKDFVLFKTLLPYIKPQTKMLILSGVLLPLISLTQVVQPFIIKHAIDGPISKGDWGAVLKLAAMFLVILLIHYALRYAQMLTAQITGQEIILSLRTALYNHLQSLPVSFFHKTPIGKLVTRISSDVENISEVFASGGIAIFADLAIIIGIIVAMFFMNAQLAGIALLIMPFVIGSIFFFRDKSRSAYNEMRIQLAHVNSFLQENISGVEVIQLLQREKHNAHVFSGFSKRLMTASVRSVVYDSSFTATVELLSSITILMVLSYIVWQTQLSAHFNISFGVLIAFLQYIQMLFEPIEEISDKFTVIQSGLASLEKIMELMQIANTLVSQANPVPLGKAQGEIRFENVSFGYHPERMILKNISLQVRPGEKVALIGATGAGKSSLIKLINRQYDPNQGRILIDGVDIRHYDVKALRQNIVVIPQDEFLFSRRVSENIVLEYPANIDLEALQRVARKVHANLVVDRLSEGYQTILPERGRNLSNGERQLLVFARALWHDPAILILDEATSSIDPQTETLLQEALETSLVGRTAIIIAHRLSTIEQVDTIYVLENGEIVESGSPKALYERQGYYWEYLNQHFQTA